MCISLECIYIAKKWYTDLPMSKKKMFQGSSSSFHGATAGYDPLVSYFLSPRPNGAVYEASCQSRCKKWIWKARFHLRPLHDGVPAYFLLVLQEFLNSVLPAQWIGRCRPKAWPASTPDLNSLHFYLWEDIKPTVWVIEVSDVQDLKQRIQNGLQTICTKPAVFQRDMLSWLRRKPSFGVRWTPLSLIFRRP